MSGSRVTALAVAMLLAAGVGQAAASGPASLPGALSPDPALPPGHHRAEPRADSDPMSSLGRRTIDALLVRSWGWCGSEGLVWDQLNSEWDELGPTPVQIDFTYDPACVGPITYEDLVARDADVLILSNPAGGGNVLTASELSAIERYVGDGHGAVGSFLAFRHSTYDNSALAPLFGIETTILDDSVPVRPTFRERVPRHPLFARIPRKYDSSGYPFAQVPLDQSWSRADLADTATYVARTRSKHGAIVVNETAAARTVYVSHMPEHHGGPTDLQFLYNAIRFVNGAPGSSPLR